MLEATRPRAGEQVLEVACGAGRVGLRAAELVGDAGSVLCTDFAEEMVAAVRDRAAELGLANVEAEVMDAEQMRFEDGVRFDVALCRMGYMLMSDPNRALVNTRAALRPGGRLAFAVWGTAEANPWISLIFDSVMKELGAPPPAPGSPGPFSLGSPGRAEQAAREAGFTGVRVERLEVDRVYESPASWWDEVLTLSRPIETLLAAMDDHPRAAARAAALEAVERYRQDDGQLHVPAEVVGVSAVA